MLAAPSNPDPIITNPGIAVLIGLIVVGLGVVYWAWWQWRIRKR
jgi:hypothetical protein